MLSHAPKSGSRLNPHSFVFGSHPERRTVRSAPKHAENSGEQRTRVGISVPAVPSGVNPKSGLRHEARVRSVTPIGLRERPTVRNAPKNAENSAEPSAHVERALAELASAERSGASRLCEKGLERRSAKTDRRSSGSTPLRRGDARAPSRRAWTPRERFSRRPLGGRSPVARPCAWGPSASSPRRAEGPLSTRPRERGAFPLLRSGCQLPLAAASCRSARRTATLCSC